MICDTINDVKLFPTTVYLRIYSGKFLTLSNQTSRYKIKFNRIHYELPYLILEVHMFL